MADHLLFVGSTEAIFSTDAVPAPVPTAPAASPCPVCSEALDGDERHTLSCTRCGTRARNLLVGVPAQRLHDAVPAEPRPR